MEDNTKLITLIQKYEEIRETKEQISEAEKEVNEAFKEIQEQIVEAMVEADVPKQGYGGFTYSPQTVVHYSFRAEDELNEEGKDKIAILKANGFGDLVKETVNQRSLESRMRGEAKLEDGIPDEVSDILKTYDELKILRRKTTGKTLDDAKAAVSRAKKVKEGA